IVWANPGSISVIVSMRPPRGDESVRDQRVREGGTASHALYRPRSPEPGEAFANRRSPPVSDTSPARPGSAAPEGHGPVPRPDLAHDPGVVPLSVDRGECCGGVGGLDDREHPETEVEDARHLVVGDRTGLLDLGEDPGLGPGSPLDDRVALTGKDPREVPRDAAPGDVRERVHVDPSPELGHDGRVDDARDEQLVAERAVLAGPRGLIERPLRDLEQRAPGQRVAVRAQARARDADDRVAGTDAGGEHTVTLDDPDREADEVELARLHDAGVLGHLA